VHREIRKNGKVVVAIVLHFENRGSIFVGVFPAGDFGVRQSD
jgi:hypothetical protein